MLAPTLETARPFLKWAGGKTQLLTQMEPFFPRRYGTYFEPFLGGGAVFFRLRPERATLSDLNPDLINVFEVVRDSPERLMAVLDSRYVGRVDARFFYRARAHRPSDSIERAAWTIFLNKTCFNGLYRVNGDGGFNVPFGHYQNPTLYEREILRTASALLRGKELRLAHYREALTSAKRGDFVYLDPPYHPLSSTSSFTSYTKEDFGDDDQRELARTVEELDRRGCLVMLSNSGTELVRSLYSGFRVNVLRAKRAINSKGNGRGAIDELLVTNFG